MTALSDALKLNLASKDARNLLALPADSVTCLQNALIGFRPSTGYAVNWTGTAGDIPVGFADKNRVAATTLYVDDSKNGKVLTGTTDTTGFPIAGLTSQSLCPALVYCSTTNIGADLTLTPTGPAVAVAVKCVSSGYGWIIPLLTSLATQSGMTFDSTNIATLAAAGTLQADAAQIIDDITNVTGADGTVGVKLPLAAAGDLRVVYNAGTSALLVYPNTSDDINDGSANASISLAPKSVGTFRAIDATTWIYDEKVDLRNAQTVVGAKTLSTTPLVDAIAEKTSAVGVTVDGVRLRDGRVNQVQAVPAAKTTTATIAKADIQNGIVTVTHAAGANQDYTLDTGTLMDTGLAWAVGESQEWTFINLSGTPATNTATLVAGADHTIVNANTLVVGSATLQNSRRIITKKTATNTFVSYVF